MSIRHKLFLAFFSAFLLLILAASGLYYLSFERGLSNYLDDRQHERVERLAEHLGGLYGQHQSWDFVADNPRQLRRLYWLAGEHDGDDSDHRKQSLVLLNQQRQRILGSANSNELQSEIAVQVNGQPVGWLSYSVHSPIRDHLDQRFRSQQLRYILWLTGIGLLLALLLSWLLSRHLVAPIIALSSHSRALQNGDYQTRPQPDRQDELGLLAGHLNQLAERLAQGQQARQRWFSDIAHELRTPLAVLRGELEALSDGIRPLTLESIQALEGDVQQLAHLIDDLHDLAMADAGNLRYQRQPLALDELVLDALERVQGSLDRHPLSVETALASPARFDGDPVRLRQLLDNLLQNTLKYTQPHGRLRIRLEGEHEHWQLVLEDSAPGVPDAALPQLFDHLFRVESSRNRRTGGAGLGLAIALRIVQAHGGTITAAHSELGGLAITIRLPR